MSYFGPTAAIISMAQQEIPIGMGHSELDRPQLIRESSRVVKIDSPNFASKPIDDHSFLHFARGVTRRWIIYEFYFAIGTILLLDRVEVLVVDMGVFFEDVSDVAAFLVAS